MNAKTSISFNSLLTPVLLIMLGLAPALYGQVKKQVLQAGTVNLSEEFFHENQVLNLEGEWHFFPGEFITPTQLVERLSAEDTTSYLAQVPGSFLDLIPSAPEGLELKSYGTYAIRISGLNPNQRLKVSGAQAYSSMDLYWFSAQAVSGELRPLLQIGHPAKTKSQTIPMIESENSGRQTEILPISENSDHFLMMHVANFHHYWGGIWLPPVIGSDTALNQLQRDLVRKLYLTFGALLIIAAYNFSLFLQRREDKGSLLLTLFTLSIIIRELSISLPEVFWPSANAWRFEISWKFNYLTIVWPAMLYLGFLRYCFGRSVNTRIFQAYFIFACFISIVFLVLPVSLSSPFLFVLQLYALTLTFYCLHCTIHAAMKRKLGARLSLLGGSILLLSLVNDIMYSRGWTFLPLNMISYGVVLFVLFQSQIVGIRFARAFRKAEQLSRTLAEEVDRQTRDIKSILESINQGILTIRAPNLSIGEDHSKYLTHLLGNRIVGQEVFEIFFARTNLNQDEMDQIKAVLEFSIGEDALAFEGNDHCFPKELTLLNTENGDARYLELDWSPIVNAQDIVEKVLICIRDVTELRELRSEAAQNREELSMIGQILNINAARFHRFIAQAKGFVAENRRLLVESSSTPKGQTLRALYINMHTLKGMARTFQLTQLTELVHGAEQFYSHLQKHPEDWDELRLYRELDEVVRMVETYYRLNNEKLGRQDHLNHIVIPNTEWKQLVTEIQSLAKQDLPEHAKSLTKHCVDIVSRHYYLPVREVFTEALSGLDSLAKELGKEPPRLIIQSNGCGVTQDGAALLNNVLTHLIRNALDHGLETSAERLASGKPAAGEIHISLFENTEGLVLQFWDDGRGLDIQRIREIGLEKGFIQPGQEPKPELLVNLIFESGFSTKSTATKISGRGMGMDAVRVYLERMGGKIEIRLLSKLGSDHRQLPVQFRIVIPNSLFGLIQDAS